MKKRTNKKNIRGYIEGYYGKLLSWDDRELIIKSLHKNNMNTYFYAPKEDRNHRLCWKKNYSKNWRLNFRKFTKISKKHKIDVIANTDVLGVLLIALYPHSLSSVVRLGCLA